MKKFGVLGCVLMFILVVHGCYTPAPPVGGGASQQPFSIRVSVGKNTYAVSEKIVISVRSTHDCYLTIYDISTIGEVTQIFPNQYATDNFIEGGYTYPIPDQKDNFDFEVTGPGGMERVRAVCTIEDVNLVESRKVDKNEAFPRISQEARGEFDKSLDAKLQVMPSERWTEASITFKVTQ